MRNITLFDFDPAYVEEGCRELGNLQGRLGVLRGARQP